MKRQLKKTEKILLALLGAVLVCFLVYKLIGVLSGKLEEEFSKKRELETQKTQVISIINNQQNTIDSFNQLFDGVLIRLDSWFDDIGQIELMNLIENLSLESNIEFNNILFNPENLGTLTAKNENVANKDGDVFLDLAKQYGELMGKDIDNTNDNSNVSNDPAENISIKYAGCSLSFETTEQKLLYLLELIEKNPKEIQIKDFNLSLAEDNKISVNMNLNFYYLNNPFN